MALDGEHAEKKRPSFFKWRARIGGFILIALGLILMAVRGFSYTFLILPAIGVILLAVGWLVIK